METPKQEGHAITSQRGLAMLRFVAEGVFLPHLVGITELTVWLRVEGA